MENIDVINKYGITLRKLTHDKIELVRYWRTHPKIAQYMGYQGEITPEQQEQWFERINNSGKDFYYIIEVDDKEIGLINIKDVDWDKLEGEPGIFIWDDDYLDTDAPMRASFCFGMFIWDVLKLERQVIHVLRDNKRAIKHNLFWGYELLPNQENVVNQAYVLTREKMEKNKKKEEKLKKYLEKIYI